MQINELKNHLSPTESIEVYFDNGKVMKIEEEWIFNETKKKMLYLKIVRAVHRGQLMHKFCFEGFYTKT